MHSPYIPNSSGVMILVHVAEVILEPSNSFSIQQCLNAVSSGLICTVFSLPPPYASAVPAAVEWVCSEQTLLLTTPPFFFIPQQIARTSCDHCWQNSLKLSSLQTIYPTVHRNAAKQATTLPLTTCLPVSSKLLYIFGSSYFITLGYICFLTFLDAFPFILMHFCSSPNETC